MWCMPSRCRTGGWGSDLMQLLSTQAQGLCAGRGERVMCTLGLHADSCSSWGWYHSRDMQEAGHLVAAGPVLRWVRGNGCCGHEAAAASNARTCRQEAVEGRVGLWAHVSAQSCGCDAAWTQAAMAAAVYTHNILPLGMRIVRALPSTQGLGAQQSYCTDLECSALWAPAWPPSHPPSVNTRPYKLHSTHDGT